MPLIDLVLKIEVIVNLLVLPFSLILPKIPGPKGKEVSIGKFIHGMIENWYETVFNLNAYEIESFEKQKKQT